jgi:hypothetical protein
MFAPADASPVTIAVPVASDAVPVAVLVPVETSVEVASVSTGSVVVLSGVADVDETSELLDVPLESVTVVVVAAGDPLVVSWSEVSASWLVAVELEELDWSSTSTSVLLEAESAAVCDVSEDDAASDDVAGAVELSDGAVAVVEVSLMVELDASADGVSSASTGMAAGTISASTTRRQRIRLSGIIRRFVSY